MIDKDNLIIKLFKGECSAKELETLFQLIEEGTLTEASNVMEELWNQTQDYPDLNSATSKKIYNRVLSVAEIDEAGIQKQKPTMAKVIKVRSNRRIFLKWAAAILIIVGLSTWFWLNNNDTGISKTETYTTAFGEQLSLELPDGSKVKLNANSSLTYDNTWDDESNRVVFLEGEAFFEVEKTVTKQKFQVVTHDLMVEVLGTTFNVNSHHDQTRIYLEEGKVKLKMKEVEKEVMMEPGELVTYSESKKEVFEKRQVTSELHTSWKDGFLIFTETPLKEVSKKMKEIYGIIIEVESEKNSLREITTGVPIDNLEMAIVILKTTMGTMGIEMKKEGDIYVTK